MYLLLKIGLLLLAGIMGGRIAKFLKLPNVSGYLVVGLFIGPSFFNVITSSNLKSMGIINELALAVIAFSIGSEFIIKDIKKVGKKVMVITLGETMGAVFVVFFIAFVLFKQDLIFSLVLASMSAATAPAATIMIINQYRAHGPLTKTILPVVALDDVFGIILFGITVSIGKILTGSTNHSYFYMISQPFIEIIGSIALGFLFGVLLSYMGNRARNKEELLAMILAVIGISTGLADLLNLSSLLTCIVIGASLVNLMGNSSRVFSITQDFISPVYILFFALAGASLEIAVLSKVGLLGVAYILARGSGKILGAWIGAKTMKAEKVVTKYLGFTLLPQGGISIGLSIILYKELPQYAVPIATIIMFSVLVYEIVGPVLAKIAIQKAGEIHGLDKKKSKTTEKKKKLVYN